MAKKRGTYQTPEHPWLVVTDMCHRLIEYSHHPKDGRVAFRAKLAALTAGGWAIEHEPIYDWVFCSRAAERIHVALLPRDPMAKECFVSLSTKIPKGAWQRPDD